MTFLLKYGIIAFMKNIINPLDELGINREHIIALQESYTHTNKKTSQKRANRLLNLLNILKKFDNRRQNLNWED